MIQLEAADSLRETSMISAGKGKKGRSGLEKETKYLQLAALLRERIQGGELKPGEKLRSENELTAAYGCSRQTVRHALSLLEEEGLLARRRGSGTYVKGFREMPPENRTRIAVISTYVDSYIFPRTIQGIENYLFERGYSVQIAFTNNLLERERIVLGDIVRMDAVGGITMEATKSGLPNPNLPLIRTLAERGIPILFINSYYRELSLPHVTLNDRQAAERAVEYLAQAGHKRIGALMKLDDGQGRLRYEGYLAACRRLGIPAGDRGTMWLDTEGEKNFSDCRAAVLRSFRDCTAVFCYNDKLAFLLENLLKEEGLGIPGDISLISVDDSELAELSDTRLTSVHHPADRLGEKAAENLLALMKNRSFDATCEFEAEIVERDSVKRLF